MNLKALCKYIFVVLLWMLIILYLARLISDFPSANLWLQIFTIEKIPGILALMICFSVVMILRSIRWGILLQYGSFRNSIRLIPVFGWCFLIMTLSPFRSGDISRVIWVRQQGGSGSSALGTLMAERVSDLIALLIYLGIVVLLYPGFSPIISRLGVSWVVGVFILYLILSYLSLPLEKYFVNKVNGLELTNNGSNWRKKLYEKIYLFFQGFSCLSKIKTNMQVFTLTLLIWGILALGFYSYLKCFFVDLNYSSAVTVLVLVNIAGLIGLSPANIGLYEMAGIVALKGFGIDPSDALVPITGLHFSMLFLTIIYGLCCRTILRNY